MGNSQSTVSDTGFTVTGKGDLSGIFKERFLGQGSTVYYTAKNGKDLSEIFEPSYSTADQIGYDTGYKCAGVDLRYKFMDINFVPIVITPSSPYTHYESVSVNNITYSFVIYEGSQSNTTTPINATLNIANAPNGYEIYYLLIGAGGGGGGGHSGGTVDNPQNYGGSGGGGGSGGATYGSTTLNNGNYSIIIPGKPQGSNSGSPCTFNSISAAGGGHGIDADNTGTGGGAGSSAGVIGLNGSTGSPSGGIYGVEINPPYTSYSATDASPAASLSVANPNALTISNGYTVNISSYSYQICGGGAGGSSANHIALGSGGAGGKGGTRYIDPNTDGNGFDGNNSGKGGFGGGGGGGGGSQTVSPYNAGNGGRGGSGLCILWWVKPPN